MLVRLLADGVLGRGDALGGGVVGELDFARHVADGEDGGDVGAAAVVCLDEPALGDLHPGVLQLQPLGDGLAAYGAQEQVGFEHFVAEVAGHAFVIGGDLFERLAGEDADAEALLHVTAHFAPHVGIEQQQNVFEQLDDGHLHAEHRRHAGQLAADESSAEHQHGLRAAG